MENFLLEVISELMRLLQELLVMEWFMEMVQKIQFSDMLLPKVQKATSKPLR